MSLIFVVQEMPASQRFVWRWFSLMWLDCVCRKLMQFIVQRKEEKLLKKELLFQFAYQLMNVFATTLHLFLIQRYASTSLSLSGNGWIQLNIWRDRSWLCVLTLSRSLDSVDLILSQEPKYQIIIWTVASLLDCSLMEYSLCWFGEPLFVCLLIVSITRGSNTPHLLSPFLEALISLILFLRHFLLLVIQSKLI